MNAALRLSAEVTEHVNELPVERLEGGLDVGGFVVGDDCGRHRHGHSVSELLTEERGLLDGGEGHHRARLGILDVVVVGRIEDQREPRGRVADVPVFEH